MIMKSLIKLLIELLIELLINLILIFPAVAILFGYFIGKLISNKKANK